MERHERLLHTLIAFERRLNLAGLNAEAADLELLVSPAQELQRAVGPPPGQVAGPVHARSGLKRARISDKTFRTQCRAIQIPASQPSSGDVEFTDYAKRYRHQADTQHISLSVPDWPANRRCHRP